MHDYDGVVDKAEGKEADPGNVENELLFHAEGDVLLGVGLKVLRIGELVLGDEEQDQSDGAGDGQDGEGGGVGLKDGAVGLKQHHQVEEHRPQKGADLIQQLLDAEALADPLLGGGEGEDGVLGGFFDGLAHTLDHQESAGPDPAVFTHQGQGRHGNDVQYVAQDGHGPVAPGLVGQLPEEVTHGVADELAQAGDKADGSG